MRFASIISLTSLALLSTVVGSPLGLETSGACKGKVTVTESFIGKDRNVKVETASCSVTPLESRMELEARQTNVCATPCNTNCFLPAGGGPDPNECHVIGDALLFESQNTGPTFLLGPSTSVSLTYNSCKTFLLNQYTDTIEFCRVYWADTINSVAFNCQASQNAHGGNCVSTDQRWFIQIQHS